MLHIVNKSSFTSTSLSSCLRFVQAGSAVLFIEDGVYGATVSSPSIEQVRSSREAIKFFALLPDVQARGVEDKIDASVHCVDYEGFVGLVIEYGVTQSWV